MAKKGSMTSRFDVTPDLLLRVLIDEDFQRAQQKNDPAVVDATMKEISRTEDRFVFEIHATEYSRGMMGIDKSKTEQSVTTYDWDLKARRGTWKYLGAQSDRVKASGVDSIEPDGEKARLRSEYTIEVKIPLVGSKIEGFVVKEIQEARPKFEATVREYCQKLS